MTEYRDATPADADAIDQLFRRSFADTFGHLYAAHDLAAFFARCTPEAWRAELATPSIAFRLAERDGELVGYAKLGPITLPVSPQGPAAELNQLYLAEQGKGTGVAQALMAWVLATARGRGAGELFLSVFIDNHRAKRFYARYGFADIGAYQFLVGSHVDEDRLMRLAL